MQSFMSVSLYYLVFILVIYPRLFTPNARGLRAREMEMCSRGFCIYKVFIASQVYVRFFRTEIISIYLMQQSGLHYSSERA